MKSVSLFEAKNKLSALIRLLGVSGPIQITVRGKPVAQISPFNGIETFEDRVKNLRESGQLQDAAAGEFWKPEGAPLKGAVSRFLKERKSE